MKRLRVVLGLACVGLLLCAGFLGAILAVLRPDRAPEEIARPRPARARVVRNAPVETPCALHVRVRDPAGAPVTAEVTILTSLHADKSTGTTWTVAGARDLPLPCGHTIVDAEARGYGRGIYAVEAVEGEPETLVIELEPGERVYGTVLDEDGEPVPEAIVRGGGRRVPTDADGSYELWVTADESALYAEAFGHDDAHARVPREAGVAPPAEGWRVDFTLVANGEIRVWCAGLPDDACGEMPLQCTVPWSPMGNRCHFDDETGETRCLCPEGTDEVAVRGGGRAVLVEAGAREAWLDFRDAGAIVGRVLLDGAPSACEVVAFRVPEALEDLPRGLVAGRFAHCEEDGRFRIDGVVEGDWEVAAQASSPEYVDRHERILVPRRVGRGAVVDVGDIRLPGGGVIEGVVIDGVTGEPLAEAAVIALREGAAHERVTAMADEGEFDGSFRLEGLPGGTWAVAPMLAPQESVTVTVREDAVTGGVRLVTSQATALAENGFELQDEDGALVVSDVTADSPADLAGLVPGDEVTGVLVAGFDVTSGMGSRGGDIARAILGHWDGPGVTLVVRGADGGEEEVPLEW